ncbi:hypothetical protein FRX31_035413 [Thalictrum thalictroides]|uniref:SANT domain-containing protein n=1 Tax=Thalictrum thalictroides TaxID=46969 RepID=A0A7J6URV0_THATH|nr:hypothetical protein FRX31_035413 [Thalictrum thalictroides]
MGIIGLSRKHYYCLRLLKFTMIDNWNYIAEHVGSKSKAQFILNFIRLPMEDGLLQNIEIPNGSIALDVSSREEHGRPYSYSNSNGDSARQCLQDLDSERRLRFANSGNSVKALDRNLEYHNIGGGAWLCPGKEMGMVEIPTFLHYFMTT